MTWIAKVITLADLLALIIISDVHYCSPLLPCYEQTPAPELEFISIQTRFLWLYWLMKYLNSFFHLFPTIFILNRSCQWSVGDFPFVIDSQPLVKYVHISYQLLGFLTHDCIWLWCHTEKKSKSLFYKCALDTLFVISLSEFVLVWETFFFSR